MIPTDGQEHHSAARLHGTVVNVSIEWILRETVVFIRFPAVQLTRSSLCVPVLSGWVSRILFFFACSSWSRVKSVGMSKNLHAPLTGSIVVVWLCSFWRKWSGSSFVTTFPWCHGVRKFPYDSSKLMFIFGTFPQMNWTTTWTTFECFSCRFIILINCTRVPHQQNSPTCREPEEEEEEETFCPHHNLHHLLYPLIIPWH